LGHLTSVNIRENIVMSNNRPNIEELLAHLEAEMEDDNEQRDAEIQADGELLYPMSMECVEGRELSIDEEYSQPLDGELDAK
jgi:hypothetical protein